LITFVVIRIIIGFFFLSIIVLLSRSVHSGMFFLLPAQSSLVSHSGTNCWMLENGKKGGEISKFR